MAANCQVERWFLRLVMTSVVMLMPAVAFQVQFMMQLLQERVTKPVRFCVLPQPRISRRTTGCGGTCAGLAATAAASPSMNNSTIWSVEQLEQYARDYQGLNMTFSTLGPFFRAVGRTCGPEPLTLGYVEGVIRPGSLSSNDDVNQKDVDFAAQQSPKNTALLVHFDKMQVFPDQVRAANVSGGLHGLGIGLWLGYRCLLHDTSLSHVEFLAIDDAPLQHKRLVKLYRHAGFTPIRYVGQGPWQLDLRDQLIWGGAGTLFRRRIPVLLQEWTGVLQRSLDKQESLRQRLADAVAPVVVYSASDFETVV
jgi:hypothetical protein